MVKKIVRAVLISFIAILVIIFCIGVFVLNPLEPKVQTPAIQKSVQVQPAIPAVPVIKPTNSEDELNHCFNMGRSSATVTMANIIGLADKDILPSRIRDLACAQVAASVPDAESCISTCELGFKAVIRDSLK